VAKAFKKIFIHGWATDSRVWKRLLKDSDIAIDLPSHGDGPGNDNDWTTPDLVPATSAIKTALAQLPKDEKLVAVGWSLGAKALIDYAAITDSRLRAIVLVGASPSFIKRDGFSHGQSEALTRRMLMDFKKSQSETLARFYRLNFTADELGDKKARDFLEIYKKIPTNFDPLGIATALQALIEIDIRGKLDKIKIPTLLIHGGQDAITPVAAAEYLSKNIKKSKLIRFQKAGHAPFITEPQGFSRAIEEFLREI